MKAECCEGEDGKYKDNLKSKDGVVCCNTPCESLENSTLANPSVCKWNDHKDNAQCGPSGKSFFGGALVYWTRYINLHCYLAQKSHCFLIILGLT